MRYGSVCSGIEAATQAWRPLGWQCAFVSEIEKFPRAVLAHHYPDVPLHGDFTTIGADEYGSIDLLVGGTPCQSFSIAGLRGGLDDDRGNLALEFLKLAQRTRPRWLVWENVPGVLSSNGGRDFGAILGGMVELGYGFAYRVLDAQYVRVDGYSRAVPQRRRRVFVVGYLGDWRRAAAVLFEREGLRGDPAPRRETGKRVADSLTVGANQCSGFPGDITKEVAGTLGARTGLSIGDKMGLENQHIDQGGVCSSPPVAMSLNAHGGRIDAETETLLPTTGGGFDVSHTLKADGSDASEDGTGRGTPIVPVSFNGRQDVIDYGPVSGPLDRLPASQCIAFSAKDHGADASDSVSPTLRAGGHTGSHANAGVMPAVAIQERAVSENPDAGPDGAGVRDDGVSHTLEARTVPQAVAFDTAQITSKTNRSNPKPGDPCHTLHGSPTHHVATGYAVRRLTPVECERLQGFPDNFTRIPWRGKPAEQCPDGPRYKALGNSMAVNVMRWIGQRIAEVDAIE